MRWFSLKGGRGESTAYRLSAKHGGGQGGSTRHFERSLGLLVWGREDVGWREFDKADPRTYNGQMVGVLGLPTLPFIPRPAYYPSCIHYVHIDLIGAVANARYMEMIDFILGWTTLDIAGGRWQEAQQVGVAFGERQVGRRQRGGTLSFYGSRRSPQSAPEA